MGLSSKNRFESAQTVLGFACGTRIFESIFRTIFTVWGGGLESEKQRALPLIYRNALLIFPTTTYRIA